jgi:hypothetical protein
MARRTAIMFRLAVVFLATLATLVAGPARAAESPLQMELKLHEAVWGKADGPAAGGPTLLLFLVRQGDQWDRVIGTAGNLNNSIHVGYVAQASITDQAIDLTIPITIYPDNYVPGGSAEYTVNLKAKDGGLFEGTYAGKYCGIDVKGKADGRVLPASKRFRPEVNPVAQGEHPRILFRKTDLPALKEKAKTPFGQAMLAKMDDDIGLAIKWQLTGDRKYADEARAIVENILEGDYSSARTAGSHHGILHYGWVWEHPGVVYDLCYDAPGWDDAFRKRVERYTVLWHQRIVYQRFMFNTQGQYNYGNPEAGQLYYGNALASLAIWGEKGPAPTKPLPPDTATEVAPAADYKPGKDVPVVPLELGKSPRKWLAATPARAIIDSDPLAELGGVEKCRPESGTAFTFGNARYAFAPIAAEFVPETGGVVINCGKSTRPDHVKMRPGPELARDGPVTYCVYTVLDNPKAQWVKVMAGSWRWGLQQFVLNGHTLADGQVVKLEKGLYPLLVVMRVRSSRVDWMEPTLLEATEVDVEKSKALVARLQKEHATALKEWELKTSLWKRSGEANQEYHESFDIARFQMYLQFREGMGTGGAQPTVSGESYSQGLQPALYASAYRTAFGYDLSPLNDITHFLPRRIFSHLYPADGSQIEQSIHGTSALGPDYFAFSFPIVPDEWKPAVLWAWDRFGGGSGEGSWSKKGGGHADTPARAFINYPLDMKSQAPKGILPLTWEAPDFGYYGFRNDWKDQNDFLFQIWLKSNTPKGYAMPNAGTFRIAGLGHEWVTGFPSVRLDNRRYFDPVLLLPEDETNQDGQARATYVHTDMDGSGTVTADLADVYCQKVQYERYGNVRNESTFKDSGVKGLRAYAVDYSGKSGAPCLIVLVDKVTGGGTKVWPWYLADVKRDPKSGKVLDPGDIKRTKVAGTTVTVTKDDGATMTLTFVGPVNAEVKAETQTLKFNKTYNRGVGTFTAPGIYASGADPKDGEFFVVVTIQRPGAAAPEVKVDGKGLAAKVTVGQQTVSFDGQKIVLGK